MMNCISYISSATMVSRNSHAITRICFYGFSSIARRRSFKAVCFGAIWKGYPIQCFSTVRRRDSRLPKVKSKPIMENESNAFYVIRKGDVVGVYKSLSDCQDLASSSICDPSVSVYKGYSLTKETETYLASRGLKDPLYVMKAADVKEDTFGTLVPCPFQQPDVHASDVVDKKTTSQKRTKQMMNSLEAVGSTSNLPEQPNKFSKVEVSIDAQPITSKYLVCTLQFDGASKGNPGPAGAGAVLLASDGRVVCRLREGLGTVTNNVAEYRALILGLKYALQKGFRHIQVYGDSKLVCMQVKGVWQTKNANMIDLCKEARRLKDMFTSFTITHVLRDLNTEADTQANLAINLSDGQVEELAGELC